MPEHISVLMQEVMAILKPKPGMTILDATLGSGGHSYALYRLVQPGGAVYSFDRDPEAVAFVESEYPREHYPGWNRHAHRVSEHPEPIEADGCMFDCGWSMRQLDLGRGFSFNKPDEPLDMRFSESVAGGDRVPALSEWLSSRSADEIERVLTLYGDEPKAKKIAEHIVEEQPQTVGDLVGIVKRVYPERYDTHPATRTWQAFRIAVNDEMRTLEEDVLAALRSLKQGGRCVIITFHSLEDRMIKQLFRFLSNRSADADIPEAWNDVSGEWKLHNPEKMYPSAEETEVNPASRSATVRALVRTE